MHEHTIILHRFDTYLHTKLNLIYHIISEFGFNFDMWTSAFNNCMITSCESSPVLSFVSLVFLFLISSLYIYIFFLP